jgi:hypothetical protein
VTEVTTVRTATGLTGLVDALDRLIGQGAAIAGEVVIGVGDVDLIRVDLRALITGVASSNREMS